MVATTMARHKLRASGPAKKLFHNPTEAPCIRVAGELARRCRCQYGEQASQTQARRLHGVVKPFPNANAESSYRRPISSHDLLHPLRDLPQRAVFNGLDQLCEGISAAFDDGGQFVQRARR